jgi:hypothetical protein
MLTLKKSDQPILQLAAGGTSSSFYLFFRRLLEL